MVGSWATPQNMFFFKNEKMFLGYYKHVSMLGLLFWCINPCRQG